ncbi:MAG: SDR family NAD(P)-dependent oxidoreductase [Phycisphaerales bacterium]
MDKRFADKTVIVTGASSGIGAEAARRFAAEGACVVLAARRREAMEMVAKSMDPDRRLIIPLDVTDTESTAGMLEQVQARFGRIDILVNNAGCHARGPVSEKEVPDLTQMVDVNLRAPIALCRMVLPYLKRAGGGAIVNVASLAGHVPFAGAAAYCATKFGLRMFSLSLAEELEGSGISVSVVSPGPVDTEFFKGQIDDIADYAFSSSMSSAEQVARLILACAFDGRRERAIPRFSKWIATACYLSPPIKRALKPLMIRIGRRNKRRYVASITQARESQ